MMMRLTLGHLRLSGLSESISNSSPFFDDEALRDRLQAIGLRRSDGQQAGVVVEGGLPGGRFGCREKVQRGFRPRPSPNTSVDLQHLSKPSCRGALLATLPRYPKVDSRLQLQAQKPMRGARAMQARRRVPAGETLPPTNHKNTRQIAPVRTRRTKARGPRKENLLLSFQGHLPCCLLS